MDAAIDTEQLELMLDDEPMCETVHEDLIDTPCSIIAVAVVITPCGGGDPRLACRMVIEEYERNDIVCLAHQRSDHIRIVRL